MLRILRQTRPSLAATPPGLREWMRDHDEKWVFVVIYLGLAVGLSLYVSLFWLLAVAGLHFVLECVRQAHFWRRPSEVVAHALWEIKLDVGLVLLALTLVLYVDMVLGLLGLQSAARAAAVSRAGVRIGSRAAAWERNVRTFLLTVDEMVRVAHAALLFGRRARGGAADPDREVVWDGAGEGTLALEPAPRMEQGREAVARPEATKTPGSAAEPEGAEAPQEDTARGKEEPVGDKAPGARKDREPEEGAEAQERAEREADAVEGSEPAERLPAWRGKWGVGDRIGLALVVSGVALIVAAPFLTPHDWATAVEALAYELRPFPTS